MKRLVTAADMRAIDAGAIEGRGIPGRDLMDRAGSETAAVILDRFEIGPGSRVAILCGRGNNGGDGFVVAARLAEAGLEADVYLVGAEPGDVRGDAADALAAWTGSGGGVTTIPDEAAWSRVLAGVASADLVVDALLGTGSTGAPRGAIGVAVAALEYLGVPVVAVDIPSGLDADTGAVPGPCVRAEMTVTMALPKRGHFLHPGRERVGRLEVVDIGIPVDVVDAHPGLRVDILEVDDLLDRLPPRHASMHKGDRGRLLVVGGSVGLTGAMALASRAAVRAGAGLVTAGVPLSLIDVMATKLTEAMTLPLPELERRALSREAFDSIALFQPGRLTALAVGPGMGRHPSTQALVRRLIEEVHLPTVLDADGLFAYNGKADLLRTRDPEPGLVLTPHWGEFTALTGEPIARLEEDRFAVAATWARRLGAVLVLKGAPTVIADPETGRVYLSPTGSEALATGGTGDVLTGFTGGLLAQGATPLDAALAATFLHGLIADHLCAEWNSPWGLQAGDLIEALPRVLGELWG